MFDRLLCTTILAVYPLVLHKHQVAEIDKTFVLCCPTEEESIKSYVKIFNEVKIEELHYDKLVTAMPFCKGLLFDNKLYHSLVKIRLKTMVEILR